ncbi:MAG: hypothetical protein ABIR29_02895 [Chthoniobacterales bacterium]
MSDLFERFTPPPSFQARGGRISDAPDLTQPDPRGAALAAFGLKSVLPDPVLELHDEHGSLIYQNDHWQGEQAQQIADSGLAPNDAHESAILITLTPGAYTAIVHDAGSGPGVALWKSTRWIPDGEKDSGSTKAAGKLLKPRTGHSYSKMGLL